MVKSNWRAVCGGVVFILFLALAIIVNPQGVFAFDEDAADDDARSAQIEKDIVSKSAKSPAIALKQTVDAQIPKPTLPAGKTKIDRIDVIGSTFLAQEAIDEIKAGFENKELNAKQMQKAADLITRAYSREGYITSYAYIVPDKLSSGILEIMVVEGKTGTIEFQGNKHFSTKLLEKKITLKEGQPFNFRQLNKDIYRINKHPDRKVSVACDPNVQTGRTNIVITVKDKSTLHSTLQVDNYGSEYIFQRRYKTYLTHNNITGHDDSVTIKVQRTEADAHQLADIDYFLPLNNTWKLELYYMPYKIEDYYYSDNEQTDFEKHARKFYFWFNQSLIDEPNCELVSQYGFKYMDIHWYQNGGDRDWKHATKKDRFRSLMWGIDFNRADKYGRWVITNDLEKGIPGMWGASPRKSDETSVPGAGSAYTKNIITVARRQKLFAGIDFIGKGKWQLSSQALTGVNVFSIGGIMGVIDNRGYPRAQAPGDSGRSFSGGFSFPPFGVPRHLNVPFSKTKLYDSVKLFTFYDWGEAILKNPTESQRETTTLSSAGFGVLFNVPDRNLATRLDVGWPTSEDDPKDDTGHYPHVWWSVTQGF
ncbi:MAG TPA: POTRA domain-containing protein [Candidatus Omnitrophota bacterium]|nr:POTRA domain-containing protein [Candidatus Omnitrophota bacterium]HPD84848.1 POTRA domain-containing protein [Candidatus Omnitrophota bacterium]HRZ03706.1 POTRA domain-containing protein [Candidatus Omnitrophota bacterium]